MSTWLPGVPRMLGQRRHCAQQTGHVYKGIVMHSGQRGPGVAEYLSGGPADGRVASAHLAWSSKLQTFAQLLDLDRRAYHAGSEGNDWIGIELSGPWDQNPRRSVERAEFMAMLPMLMIAVPTLEHWCRHSEITPGKLDPGPGFDESWVECSGLTWGAPG